MSKLRALDVAKARMRDRAEYYLLQDSLKKLRNNAPSTVDAYQHRKGVLWRGVFVPLYTRVPWTYKQKAMEAAKMTARGWTPPKREPGIPWKPPAPKP